MAPTEQRDKLEVALLLKPEGALTDGARKLAFYRPLSHQIPNSNFATRLSPTFCHWIQMQSFSSLTPADLLKNPIWEFCNDLESDFPDESVVRPIKDLPVTNLDNRLVGTKLRLANGDSVMGILSNINLNDHFQTEHFLTVSLFREDGKMFCLARYHDANINSHGPNECASFFELDVEEMFPIRYDINSVAIGAQSSVRREVSVSPVRRLDEDDLMRMALEG